MHKGQLYFFVAPARAGKTTVANKWVTYQIDIRSQGDIYVRSGNGNYLRKLYPEDKPRVIVSGDDIRLALTGQRFCREAEKSVHATKYLMVRTLINRGHDVLMDSTNTTEKSIRDMLREYPTATQCWIDTTRDVCKERAIASGQEDLIEHGVIDRMHDNVDKLMEKYNCPDMNAVVEFIREDME